MKRAYYLFDGDLAQLGAIESALRAVGFKVLRSNVYPGFAEDDRTEYLRALGYLFEQRIEGWWNQERPLIAHGICTQEEFDRALGRPARLLEDAIDEALPLLGDFRPERFDEYREAGQTGVLLRLQDAARILLAYATAALPCLERRTDPRLHRLQAAIAAADR